MTPSNQSYREIALTQGRVAKVSISHFDEVNSFRWSARWDKKGRCFYAVRHGIVVDGVRTTVLMHRYILGLERGDVRTGDHINHDTLDNRDENLRIPPTRYGQTQNQGIRSDNSSGYKGVSYCQTMKKWRTRIQAGGEAILVGYFDTKEEAYSAYCDAALKYHGEFARVA